jgi:hypothetical protein
VSTRALPPGIALVALAILGLNLLDVAFTLQHLELGAIELNPLMRELLEEGPLAFVVGKHLMVGTGVVAIAGQSGSLLAFAALRFLLLPVYALTAAYQVVLLGVGG